MASKACLQAATTASSLSPSLAHAKFFLSLYLRVAWTSAFKQFLLFFRTTSFAKATKNKTLWERIFERRCTTKNRTRFAREDIGLCSFCGSTVKE